MRPDLVLLLALLLPISSAAAATPLSNPPLDIARSVRGHGCSAHRGIQALLRDNSALDAAAAQWSRGSPLQAAIAQSGYREEQSAALHVSGDPVALQQALSANLCTALTNGSFVDIGSAHSGRDSWIIVAAPFAPPRALDAAAISTQLLERINAARAQARRCGRAELAAAPPLRLNALLTRAAQAHARDMLDRNYFAHESPDGATPATRVTAVGYDYRIVGENIAFGPESVAEAVSGWLASPEHCLNIMDARFTETGFAYAANDRGAPRIYWVEDFGSVR